MASAIGSPPTAPTSATPAGPRSRRAAPRADATAPPDSRGIQPVHEFLRVAGVQQPVYMKLGPMRTAARGITSQQRGNLAASAWSARPAQDWSRSAGCPGVASVYRSRHGVAASVASLGVIVSPVRGSGVGMSVLQEITRGPGSLMSGGTRPGASRLPRPGRAWSSLLPRVFVRVLLRLSGFPTASRHLARC